MAGSFMGDDDNRPQLTGSFSFERTSQRVGFETDEYAADHFNVVFDPSTVAPEYVTGGKVQISALQTLCCIKL